ncbi:hypothetical protein C0989_002222 [Termitomyces sp. Mn162]|nr:hypothetical protein C0989_002222 [Termitomyces sp. Mn162]
MGKKGDQGAYSRASSFLLQSSLVPKLFTTFAQRYANRPGGYTRIHKLGNRLGDNAPRAILELVDNPRDLRWEMTARSIGWEMVKGRLRTSKAPFVINQGPAGTQEVVEKELKMKFDQSGGLLRPRTRSYLQKVMRYRDDKAPAELSEKVGEYMVCPVQIVCHGVWSLNLSMKGPLVGNSAGYSFDARRSERKEYPEYRSTPQGWANSTWRNPFWAQSRSRSSWTPPATTKRTCTVHASPFWP